MKKKAKKKKSKKSSKKKTFKDYQIPESPVPVRDRGNSFIWEQRDTVTGKKNKGNPLSKKHIPPHEMDEIFGEFGDDLNGETERYD